jgi:acyl carrier protein
MEIIFILEDEFSLEIPDDEYPNLNNFRKLVDYIKEHINE